MQWEQAETETYIEQSETTSAMIGSVSREMKENVSDWITKALSENNARCDWRRDSSAREQKLFFVSSHSSTVKIRLGEDIT